MRIAGMAETRAVSIFSTSSRDTRPFEMSSDVDIEYIEKQNDPNTHLKLACSLQLFGCSFELVHQEMPPLFLASTEILDICLNNPIYPPHKQSQKDHAN